MESLASLYKIHIATLQERTRDALARFKLDALLIHSGELFNVFLDDYRYPFKVNRQFKGGCSNSGAKLLAAGGWREKPKLWFYLPVDYWHNVEPLPNSFWTEDVKRSRRPKPMALVVCCLLRAAISVISVRCQNVRCNWVLRPAISTRKG
ncbi:hypothetical protein ACLK1Z_22060 [Escherichia coli]